jgi:hypothetical protein
MAIKLAVHWAHPTASTYRVMAVVNSRDELLEEVAGYVLRQAPTMHDVV